MSAHSRQSRISSSLPSFRRRKLWDIEDRFHYSLVGTCLDLDEESGHRLATLLAQADAVLCPLDCISHDAVHRIKQDCKRHGKPLKLLPRASRASFTRGLQEMVAG